MFEERIVSLHAHDGVGRLARTLLSQGTQDPVQYQARQLFVVVKVHHVGFFGLLRDALCEGEEEVVEPVLSATIFEDAHEALVHVALVLGQMVLGCLQLIDHLLLDAQEVLTHERRLGTIESLAHGSGQRIIARVEGVRFAELLQEVELQLDVELSVPRVHGRQERVDDVATSGREPCLHVRLEWLVVPADSQMVVIVGPDHAQDGRDGTMDEPDTVVLGEVLHLAEVQEINRSHDVLRMKVHGQFAGHGTRGELFFAALHVDMDLVVKERVTYILYHTYYILSIAKDPLVRGLAILRFPLGNGVNEHECQCEEGCRAGLLPMCANFFAGIFEDLHVFGC